MRDVVTAALAATVLCGSARADGFYYQQSYGFSSARGDDAHVIGESLQLRIALGWRWGAFQLGPTYYGNLAWHRDGAFLNLVGGEPQPGDSDLEVYGLDGKLNAIVWRNLTAYVRGGPRYAHGTAGVLEGAIGPGVGVGTGLALTGRVRALGFLFAPLFFSKKGPMINATLFIDQNVEWYRMHSDAMSSDVRLPLVGTSIGFGAGSFF